MGEKLAISVITPVYNGERYIRECIESVRNQTGVNIEHIVVDDGSTDATASIGFEYDHIELLRQDRNGANAARNRALEIASGEYVKFLDADDLLSSGALEMQLRKATALGSREISYGYCEVFNESGERRVNRRPDTRAGVNMVSDCIVRNISISLPLYPVEALRRVGGFDNRMIARQEWHLNIKLACRGFKFKLDDVLVFMQRVHASPSRISNRKLVLEDELRNLEWAFETVAQVESDIVIDAWASYLWGVGRQFVLQGDKYGAMEFFSRAKALSPNGYSRFLSKQYSVASRVLGPILAEHLYSWLTRSRKWIM